MHKLFSLSLTRTRTPAKYIQHCTKRFSAKFSFSCKMCVYEKRNVHHKIISAYKFGFKSV